MEEYGLVSIITPSYNCGKFIEASIQSVLAQTYQNWELLIIDDCSNDDTEVHVAKYKDIRIKYYKLAVNSGAAVARNKALQEAKGKWIAFLDSDDIWKPEKLERQLNFMNSNGIAFSYHSYSEINEDNCLLGINVGGKKKVNQFDMFACCWPGCLTVMYDVSKVGLIQIKNVKKNNDTAIWLKVIKKVNCYFLNENLAYYRRRKGSITPLKLRQRIWHHYPLFRDAEEMNPLLSFFWVIINIFGNAYKKIFYVKKHDASSHID